MRAGVTIVDPAPRSSTSACGSGRTRSSSRPRYLRGATAAGAGCRIGPLTTLIDATLGDDVRVPHSYVQGPVEVRDGVTIGPFAYLRPGTVLRDGAKAGTFVEIKNSDIGEGAKVPHLSYIGDADVGARTNLGAATITANYDGRRKHRTTIGEGVRTGVDTTFVAPVTVGDGAYTAAGSVITEGRPARRARRRARAPDQRRGLRAPQGRRRLTAPLRRRRRRLRTLRPVVTVHPQTATAPATEPPDRLRQAADAVLGAREPRAGREDRRQARRRPRPRHAQDVLQRRGLLPLRGVDPRRRRLHHPADLRATPSDGHQRQRRAHGAAAHDRRRRRRVGAPRHRRHAVVRLLAARTRSPRRASRSARASSRGCSRPRAPTAS